MWVILQSKSTFTSLFVFFSINLSHPVLCLFCYMKSKISCNLVECSMKKGPPPKERFPFYLSLLNLKVPEGQFPSAQ